jgi:hypothetical protein
MTLKIAVLIAVVTAGYTALVAQEQKPVPKNSVRVSIPGCSRGYVFTTGPRTADEAGSASVPDGLHVRMNGTKKLMAEIKAHEGSMIVITGTMKEGQFRPDGVNLGGGVRVGPGVGPTGGSPIGNPIANQIMIDVEGWRSIAGNCPSR